MENSILLTILGSFISLLLIVNAYFTRKSLEKMISIELRLVEYSTKHDATEERSRKNEVESYKSRDRLHSLEGSVGTIVKHLEL